MKEKVQCHGELFQHSSGSLAKSELLILTVVNTSTVLNDTFRCRTVKGEIEDVVESQLSICVIHVWAAVKEEKKNV